MNEKEFNSQICTTKEQSQRLLDLGLKPETADMSYYILDDEPVLIIGITQVYREILKGGKIVKKQNAEKIPAWSLHRLIELMDVYEVILEWKFGIYECAISILEERIKDGLINKEYLKQ